MDDLLAFARLVGVLRPWLGHVVVVGGWAHRLHRFHPRAQLLPHQPLRTRDADVALSATPPSAGDLAAALDDADFREELHGEHTPPVTQYRLGGVDAGFYVEFLAPRHGNGLTRSRASDATVAWAGVTAQRLRYLELLLASPWSVHLDASVGFPLPEPAEVQVANPVSFIAQKLLIQARRPPEKQPQDVLYIHDTLELFGHDLDGLRAEWLKRVRPHLAQQTVKEIDRTRRRLFAEVTDVIRRAVRIPQDRALTPDRVRAACEYGLDAVFGTA